MPGSFIAADSFQLTTAADGAGAGKSFLVNPQTSGVYMVVLGYKMSFKYGTSETTQPTLGILRASTTIGVVAGTERLACYALTADGDPVGGLYDTVPSGVITDLGFIERLFAPPSPSAAPGGDVPISNLPWQWFDTPIVLVAQEMIIAKQLDGGSAAEDRIVNLSWAWDEFTAPSGSVGLVRQYFGSRKRR